MRPGLAGRSETGPHRPGSRWELNHRTCRASAKLQPRSGRRVELGPPGKPDHRRRETRAEAFPEPFLSTSKELIVNPRISGKSSVGSESEQIATTSTETRTRNPAHRENVRSSHKRTRAVHTKRITNVQRTQRHLPNRYRALVFSFKLLSLMFLNTHVVEQSAHARNPRDSGG